MTMTGAADIAARLDRLPSSSFHRRLLIVVGLAFFSVASLLNGLAPDLPLLLAARFLTGIGISSATVVVMTIVSEFFPPDQRGRFQSWAMVIALAGIGDRRWRVTGVQA